MVTFERARGRESVCVASEGKSLESNGQISVLDSFSPCSFLCERVFIK